MAHKLRTMLSVIGMAVGIGSVAIVVSAGQGTERRILQSIRNMGTNLIVVNAGQTRIMAGRKRQTATVTTLLPSDAKAILEHCPSVALASPVVTKKLTARWGAGVVPVEVVGMTVEGYVIRNTTIASGRVSTPEEGRAKRRVAVLAPTAASNLYDGNDPIGTRFRLGRVPFETIGVTEPKGMDANGVDQDDVIYVPLETAMRRLMNVPYVQSIYVQAAGVDKLDAAEAEIRELLRQRHRLYGRPDDFSIQNQATLIEAERETVRAMTLLVGSVAGISLIVGGVGILAVMLLSVRERTREIGLRRALGARCKDIQNQFLIESTMLASTGGAIGVIGGIGIAYLMPLLGYWETVISWPTVGGTVLFSSTLGVVFGLYPAMRAAHLEPITALGAE
jgi:putative ABC transport system permease protein